MILRILLTIALFLQAYQALAVDPFTIEDQEVRGESDNLEEAQLLAMKRGYKAAKRGRSIISTLKMLKAFAKRQQLSGKG
jgi:hypothetical protein